MRDFLYLYVVNINSEIMKHSVYFSTGDNTFLIFLFLLFCLPSLGQKAANAPSPLPDRINIIVSVSCMPCHSSDGGLLSRSKLNFNEWTDYSAEKQKKKAAKMYKELKKDAMPPKEARENNPEIIPSKEQIEIIKSWADSF
jgi:hypothetical protein